MSIQKLMKKVACVSLSVIIYCLIAAWLYNTWLLFDTSLSFGADLIKDGQTVWGLLAITGGGLVSLISLSICISFLGEVTFKSDNSEKHKGRKRQV